MKGYVLFQTTSSFQWFYGAEEKEREAAIVDQALIHTMNQLCCILLPAVIVIPDGLMANKSEEELLIRVCSQLRDKNVKKKKNILMLTVFIPALPVRVAGLGPVWL